MSALTGVVSVILFLPCVFKEFSAQDKISSDGNAGDDTTETLNIAEAEAMNANGSSLPNTSIKGSTPIYYYCLLCSIERLKQTKAIQF